MPMPYYQNPMMPNYQQYPMQQSFQPAYQAPMLTGKTVNSFAEITANDVPMTGGFAVFPKADLSEIEIRSWNSNGTISARSFKPVAIEQQETTAGISDQIMDKLNSIEKLLEGKANEHD